MNDHMEVNHGEITTTPDYIESSDSSEQESNALALLREVVETFLLAIILFLVVNTITSRYEVESLSMEPTLHEGEYLIVSKISYWFRQPERGDIVVLDPPNNQSEIPYIKRVVGLPGEMIEAHDGRIWINGTALNESYISGPPDYKGNWALQENEYFVLGDNRNNSSDSHSWGLLPRKNILGIAVFRYWPLNKWGIFPHPVYPELEAN